MIAGEEAAKAFVAKRCDAAAMARLDRLVQALTEENRRQNLVARRSLDSVWARHIADSAQLLDHVGHPERPWLDLGTGAGFPGLVIAAMRPTWPVRLVESRARRADWLAGMAGELALSACLVHAQKLENVDGFPAAVISARAFAPLAKLLRLSARFSTAETVWLLPKGRSAAQETVELPRRLRTMFHVEQSLTEADSGIVIGKGRVEPET